MPKHIFLKFLNLLTAMIFLFLGMQPLDAHSVEKAFDEKSILPAAAEKIPGLQSNHVAELKAKEYNIPNLYSDLGIQLFKITTFNKEGRKTNDFEVISDGKNVEKFIMSFGGPGLTSIVYDQHNKMLYYTYGWGSGIHRSHAERLTKDADDKITVSSFGVFENKTVLFEKNKEGEIILFNASIFTKTPVKAFDVNNAELFTPIPFPFEE